MTSSKLLLRISILYSDIPSTEDNQEYTEIRIRSLTAKTKSKKYDDTIAFFVAGLKFQNRWYTNHSVTINGRAIGPGTVVISTKSELKIKRKKIEKDTRNRWSLFRILLTDFLGLRPNSQDIQRTGLYFDEYLGGFILKTLGDVKS